MHRTPCTIFLQFPHTTLPVFTSITATAELAFNAMSFTAVAIGDGGGGGSGCDAGEEVIGEDRLLRVVMSYS